MPVSTEFLEFLVDQLGPLGPVRSKRMFGGAGLFMDGTMFGLVVDDGLYLKADDENRPDPRHDQGQEQGAPEHGVHQVQPSDLGQTRKNIYGDSGREHARPFSGNQVAGGCLEAD